MICKINDLSLFKKIRLHCLSINSNTWFLSSKGGRVAHKIAQEIGKVSLNSRVRNLNDCFHCQYLNLSMTNDGLISHLYVLIFSQKFMVISRRIHFTAFWRAKNWTLSIPVLYTLATCSGQIVWPIHINWATNHLWNWSMIPSWTQLAGSDPHFHGFIESMPIPENNCEIKVDIWEGERTL